MTSTPVGETYYSPAQLAQQWERPLLFVRQMISEGKLATDERGLVSNTALRDFYRTHGNPVL